MNDIANPIAQNIPSRKAGEYEVAVGAATDNPITVSLSASMKVNLGNYESADTFVSLSGVPVGATEAMIEEALDTAKVAFSLVRKRVLEQARELKAI